MTAPILRALPLWTLSCAAVATAGPLTGPALSSREAFELCTKPGAETMRDYRSDGCVDDLLCDSEEVATSHVQRLILIRSSEPTGVLVDILSNPAEDASWWRSGAVGVSGLGSFHAGLGELTAL